MCIKLICIFLFGWYTKISIFINIKMGEGVVSFEIIVSQSLFRICNEK